MMAAWLSLTMTGCSAPANDYVPEDTPFVGSKPGLVQNGGGSDEFVFEQEACQRYRQALVQRTAALSCSFSWPSCPQLIRPAASLDCVAYSSPSVVACEKVFAEAEGCEQLLPGSCLLTAVIDYRDPSCDSTVDGGVPILTEAGDADDAGLPNSRDGGAEPSDALPDADGSASDGGHGDGGGVAVVVVSSDAGTAGVDAGAGRDASADGGSGVAP